MNNSKYIFGTLIIGLFFVFSGCDDNDDNPIPPADRSKEHTSELQSHPDLVCRLRLEKKNINTNNQPQ